MLTTDTRLEKLKRSQTLDELLTRIAGFALLGFGAWFGSEILQAKSLLSVDRLFENVLCFGALLYGVLLSLGLDIWNLPILRGLFGNRLVPETELEELIELVSDYPRAEAMLENYREQIWPPPRQHLRALRRQLLRACDAV